MSKPASHLYEFGQFRLDTAEHLLLRNGEAIPLTPKAFETLVVLVRHSGHLVYKDELMKEVWPDTIVEENNLDKSISVLRKALGEGISDQTYIETVRRRGYRFVPSVREVREQDASLQIVRERTRSSVVIEEEETEIQDHAGGQNTDVDTSILNSNGQRAGEALQVPARRATSSDAHLIGKLKPDRRGVPLAAAATIVLVVVVAAVAFAFMLYKFFRQDRSEAPFEKVRLARLTTTGKAVRAAISPDGKYIAHVVNDAGQQSLWIRQVATGRNLQIVPPARLEYFGLTFSHDGSYVYYVSWEMNYLSILFRVPSLGGEPTRLIDDVDTPVTLSPDDKRLAFVRISPGTKERIIVVAKVDGTSEQKIFSDSASSFKIAQKPNTRPSSPAWSPDGKTIACTVQIADSGGERQTIFGLQMEDGTFKPLTSQRWPTVARMEWLADGRGLVLAAAEQESNPAQQIWYVAYPDGEARKITNDLSDYQDVSLTGDSRTVVAVQSERQGNIFIAPENDASRATQITSTNYDGLAGISWTPERKIVYTSRASGNEDLWITGADGGHQKQLTANAGINRQPVVSPDGRYIVFVSERAGTYHLWRIDADGHHPQQLTDGIDDIDPSFSPDGRWLVFRSLTPGSHMPNLFRVSIDGGEPVRLTDRISGEPTVSPDGHLIAFFYREELATPNKFAVMPFEGGEPQIICDLPKLSGGFHWTVDSKALAYVSDRDNHTNIWIQPLGGGPPHQLTDWKSDRIFSFDWSSDGKQLACARGIVTSDIVQISDLR